MAPFLKWLGKKDWRVEMRWKEELLYFEGERWLYFLCTMGNNRRTLYFPNQGQWETRAPEWCRRRREEILARIHTAHPALVLHEEEDAPFEAG